MHNSLMYMIYLEEWLKGVTACCRGKLTSFIFRKCIDKSPLLYIFTAAVLVGLDNIMTIHNAVQVAYTSEFSLHQKQLNKSAINEVDRHRDT